MSFPPNNFQAGTTNAFFPMPPPPNPPQQHANTNPTNLNQGADAVNSNANWFNQQNWQQQQNSHLQHQVDSQRQQNFFATIPSNQSYLQQPQQPSQAANNILRPQNHITGDGWGDWDDWNHNESKSLSNNDNVSQGDPAQQNQNVLGDSFQRNDNWQWQGNQSINSSQQLNQQPFQAQPTINWMSGQDTSISTASTPALQSQPVQRSVHEVKQAQTHFQSEFAVSKPLTDEASISSSTSISNLQPTTGASPPATIPTSYFHVDPTRPKPAAVGASSTPPFLSVSSVNTDPMNVPTTSIHSLPSTNWQNVKEQVSGLRRSGQIQRDNIKTASTSVNSLNSLMTPSTTIPPPISENQDLAIPDNFEVFENSGQSSRVSLPNTLQNVGESSTFIPPAPQLFETRSDEPAFNVPEQSILRPPINMVSRQQNNTSETPITLASRPQVSITAPILRSQTNIEASTVHLPAIHSLEDRERFLNQENVSNERDRFINQTEGTDNLLPPPIAYQQPTPNDDRNQYLQTSHLSEDDFVVLNNPSNDEDVNLPPPGLSRFVLGEPEQTGDNERHADGEDDNAIQPPPTNISSDINRNMYPFSSHMDQVQRVVTGVESMTISQPLNMNPQQVESREIDMDGENIEDQQQAAAAPKQLREEPTIGGDPSSNEPELNPGASSNVTDSKNLSNSSTGNDSDHHNRSSNRKYSSRGGKNRKRYDSDESEGSSERDRQRHKDKERKRKDHGQNSDDGDSYRQKNVKGRDEKHRHNTSRYDDSRYETEESTRYDRSGRRQDRRDRDRKYDDEIKRSGNHRRSYRGERAERRGGDGDRERRDNRDRSDREDNRDRRRRTTEQKHRNYDDNYQSYNRKNNSSRNARDSDYEKDSRYRRYNMYSGYEYDPYAYYHQHQQYFEQLRRTNPQSYAEWYRKYYAQMQGDSLGGTDCRESVHSGRSSAAGHVNDKDRPENMSNLEERSVVQDDLNENIQPGRLTPYKFSNDHAVLSLVSGVLVCGKPKYSHSNGLQNIVKLINISPNDSTKKLFQAFPGPLVKGITHKKTLIEYCEERIKHGPHFSNRMRSRQGSSNSLQSLSSSQQGSQSSYVLLWNLLILLLRQNGVVVGTDIAELLVKNQKLFPYELSSSSKRNSINSIEKEVKGGSNESNTSEIEDNDLNDSNASSDGKEQQLNDEQITDKFRNYLLYGNVKDALEWATDNNLWGHALFLASKVDRRLHANVMMKFANKLQLNDPLQTLYQLMSGRCPSSVTSVQDERWGDWRPHLAMIISNTTQSPDLNRKAITSLGDSLINRGDLFAAQFCYLMSQVGFGKYASANESVTTANMVRLVLLGSSHIKANSFLEFASNDAIIMTEIYEYACSLNDERFSIVEFQPYKFLLACRLLDYGFHLKAFMYLEQISIHIQKDSSRYEALFVDKVYNLADKLKFYDPVMEKTYGDGSDVQFEDQEWLKNLRILNDQNALSTGNGNNSQQYQQSFEHNNFETNLNTIPENGSIQQMPGMITQSENQLPNHYYQQEHSSMTNEVFQGGDAYGNFYQPTLQQPEFSDDSKNQQQHLQQQHQQFPQQTAFNQQEPFLPESMQSNYTGGYDYYNPNPTPEGFHQQQEQTAPLPTPSISMPNTASGPKRSIFDEEDHGSSQQHKIGGTSEVKKEESKKSIQQQKQSSSSSQNTGWFGGIFNKFSVKPKNQMILPDDKNPTIVWDAEKKKWINTDEGEESQENFAPPPKISNCAPQLQQLEQLQQPLQNQLQPVPQFTQPQSATVQNSGGITNTMAAIPAADPQVQAQLKSTGLQSNMFKMQRNRTLKKSYVDVFNPSGVSTKPSESILAPSLPPLPQTGFMVPGGGQPQQSSQGAAQFYDPNAYGGSSNQ